MPKVVLGLPLYSGDAHLAEAVESVLAQTFGDFAIVALDDGPPGPAEVLVRRYAATDARIHYEHNGERLGLVGNWRRTFTEGTRRHPDARYFAWISDHDLWHPRFLERLVGELDADPRLVGAYPVTMRIRDDSGGLRVVDDRFETRAIDSPAARVRAATRGMAAGDMVYGVFSIDAMRRAGIFRHVLLPDRLFLTELALQGGFAHVDEILWYRRWRADATFARQRASFFLAGVPAHAYVPPALTHAAILGWRLAVKGEGRPEIGRRDGAAIAAVHLYDGVRGRALRWTHKRERRLRRRYRDARMRLGAVYYRILKRPPSGR